jgi:hypothetical protein
MGYQLHSLSLAKVEKVTLIQFFEHYQNICQTIGCLMLSLLIMFKLKSMCSGLISLNLHTIPCLLLVYYSAYFVTKPNSLANHFLLHIIFWHKLCLFCKALVLSKHVLFHASWHPQTFYSTTGKTNFYKWCFPMQQCLAKGQSFLMFVACVQSMGIICCKKNSKNRRLNEILSVLFFF